MTADNTPHIFALDKRTGERVGQLEIPAQSSYGMSGWILDGKQYILVQQPTGLVAFAIDPPEVH
jgi:quinoprotein glucose dehydrogenase